MRAFAIADFVSPHPEETTAYIVYMLETMAEIADILGKSEWRRENGKTIYSITVPSNVMVKAILPDGEHILTLGAYEISV